MIGQRVPESLTVRLVFESGFAQSNFGEKAGTNFRLISPRRRSWNAFLLGARCEGDMLGLDGYGSSDDEGGDARVEPTGPTSVDTASDPGTQNHGAHAELGTVPTPRVSALPSAAALFGAKVGGVGSISVAQVAASSFGGSVLGTKRSASGSFPISGTAQKSNRSDARALPGGKPRNTLLPPQLRGRSNSATQDLEGMGLRRKSGGVKPPSGGG